MNTMLSGDYAKLMRAVNIVHWWPDSDEEMSMKDHHVRKYLRDAGASTAEINKICRHPRMSTIVSNLVKAAECGGYECAIRRAVCKMFGVSGEIISKIIYTNPPVALEDRLEKPEAVENIFEIPEKPKR